MQLSWAATSDRLKSGQSISAFHGRVLGCGLLCMALATVASAESEPRDVPMTTVDARVLAQTLESGELAARRDAAEQLAQLGEEARPAAVSLVLATATDDEDLREWAVGALEGLGPPDDTDASRLAELLKHEQLDVAYWAATLLGRLGEQASSTVPALVSALNGHPEPAVRERAAWALGKMGSEAAPAKDDLAQAAKSSNARLAKLAQTALEHI